MGNIKAFDSLRQMRHFQSIRQFLQCRRSLFLQGCVPFRTLSQHLGRIFAGQLHQLPFRPPLRRHKLDCAVFSFTQPLRQQFLLRQRHWRQNLPWHKSDLVIVLFDKCRQNIAVGLGLAAGKQKPVPSDHFPAAHEENLYAGLVAQSGQPEYILIARTGHDILFLRHLPNRRQLIPQSGSQLEFHFFRSSQHPTLQIFFHIGRSSLKKQAYCLHHFPVCLDIHHAGAGG